MACVGHRGLHMRAVIEVTDSDLLSAGTTAQRHNPLGTTRTICWTTINIYYLKKTVIEATGTYSQPGPPQRHSPLGTTCTVCWTTMNIYYLNKTVIEATVTYSQPGPPRRHSPLGTTCTICWFLYTTPIGLDSDPTQALGIQEVTYTRSFVSLLKETDHNTSDRQHVLTSHRCQRISRAHFFCIFTTQSHY